MQDRIWRFRSRSRPGTGYSAYTYNMPTRRTALVVFLVLGAAVGVAVAMPPCRCATLQVQLPRKPAPPVQGNIGDPSSWKPQLRGGVAVVNAANADVVGAGMGGVTHALFQAVGGAAAWTRLIAQGQLFQDGAFTAPPKLPLPTCTSVLRTGTAGDLAAQGIRYMFHVAGPDCSAGQHVSLLPMCYETALAAAAATPGITHLVIPLLSGGIYGCPTSLDDATRLLQQWVAAHPESGLTPHLIQYVT